MFRMPSTNSNLNKSMFEPKDQIGTMGGPALPFGRYAVSRFAMFHGRASWARLTSSEFHWKMDSFESSFQPMWFCCLYSLYFFWDMTFLSSVYQNSFTSFVLNQIKTRFTWLKSSFKVRMIVNQFQKLRSFCHNHGWKWLFHTMPRCKISILPVSH